MNDIDLCRAAMDAYAIAPSFVVAGDVHAVVRRLDGFTVIAFRGTVPTNWMDWFRDLRIWPQRVVTHPRLGHCHQGFVTGAEAALPKLRNAVAGQRYVLTGHSLGGALAIAAGALLTDGGLPPARLTTFGAPRVGWSLDEVLASVPGARWRNGNDPIPEVPVWPYSTDRAWSAIGADERDPFCCHPIERYVAAMAAADAVVPA